MIESEKIFKILVIGMITIIIILFGSGTFFIIRDGINKQKSVIIDAPIDEPSGVIVEYNNKTGKGATGSGKGYKPFKFIVKDYRLKKIVKFAYNQFALCDFKGTWENNVLLVKAININILRSY